jgi:heme oxygenase (mycobilin-producing)
MPTGAVLIVTRFIVPDETPDFTAGFVANGARLRIAFEARPGHVRSTLARALEDPTRWVLVSEWTGVGAWRRALSAYDVRIEVMPLMALAENEPAVYENPDGF